MMTAFLRQTVPKRPPRRKSINLLPIYQEGKAEDSINYSTIEDIEDSSHFLSDALTKKGLNLPIVTSKAELVYATVSKNKKSSCIKSGVSSAPRLYEDKDILVQRIRELSEENRLLRRQTHDYLKREKEKEETVHAKLQLEITQLETETRKEVKSLSDKIKILNEERSSLNDQIDLLQGEKKEIFLKSEALTEKMKTMISSQAHKKMIAEYRKLLNGTKENHQEEISKYKQLLENSEKEKGLLETQVCNQKEMLEASAKKLPNLESANYKLQLENAELLKKIEQSLLIQHDNEKLLLSLLKVTEGIAVERDVLLTRASLHEDQQKELQNSVVNYTLNIGRLQEHISNLSKENVDGLLSMHKKKHQQDEQRQDLYAKQLVTLREKTLDQNNIIDSLESEKKRLELQLESRWGFYLGEMKSFIE